VVGSLNLDLVVRAPVLPAPGTTVLGGSFERHPGGKGGNQAVAAARVGAAVHFVGAAGDDDMGASLIDDLRREGIDVCGVERIPGTASGMALIVVDSDGQNQIAVASGANAALTAGWVAQAIKALPLGPSWVCLIGLEIPDEAIAAAADLATEAGVSIVLNPAPARRLDERVLALGPLLTPNEAEVRMLAAEPGADAADPDAQRDDADAETAARALAERTGAPVVVTLGREGALVVDPPNGATERYPGIAVEAVDATGAGDAFSGILAAELARGAELPDAIRYAIAGAALSVTVAGAREGLPSRDRIEALLSAGRDAA
jgi:ribokinase